jgi:hypothetical protein
MIAFFGRAKLANEIANSNLQIVIFTYTLCARLQERSGIRSVNRM